MNAPRIISSTRNHRCQASPIMSSAQRSLDSHSAEGKRNFAAAADRNKEHILDVLKSRLPSSTTTSASSTTTILEIASGTGQHIAHFSQAFPHLIWQPTETSEECFESISAWASPCNNIALPPLLLDASSPPEAWPLPLSSCAAILCVNMSHISPYIATQGLFAGADRVLSSGGRLFLYGPFLVDGKPTTESNANFDRVLKGNNPQWGLRDVAEVDSCAAAAGLAREEMISMPANNFMLVYVKK